LRDEFEKQDAAFIFVVLPKAEVKPLTDLKIDRHAGPRLERGSDPAQSRVTLGSSTVLITGGGEGIGLGLAAHYLAAGSTVIITGRSGAKLRHAAG
jgi:hypothetical protein